MYDKGTFIPNFDFLEELQWRGLLHDSIPGTDELLNKERVAAYIGFDPTADSLHIGNMVPIMLLTLFQRAGHTPVVLVGGATGRVGDPSGKSAERQLLDSDAIQRNLDGQKAQLMRFLDFENGENKAVVVNNYDWFKEWSFLDFIRDVGKHITVSYMMSKDSVKNRLEAGGLSFTEFTYQLVQGYDFLHLYREMGVKLQMGGSDQWGNITTGTELIRKTIQGDAFAITAPLVTKSDGTKFGKSEGGNVWLDSAKTPVFTFYQFWLNTTDDDAMTYIKIFTFLTKNSIENKIKEHSKAPHLRLLQKIIAEEVTTLVHGKEAYLKALEVSQILFGKSTDDALQKLDTQTFLEIFAGVPQAKIKRSLLDDGIDIVTVLTNETGFFNSKGEARRAINQNAISVNQSKVTLDYFIGIEDLIANQYVLLQRGKKNYFVIKVND